jgi:hypothetical protein
MRAAARAEVAALDDDDVVTDRQIDEVLYAFFSRVPESEGFGIALDALAEETSWHNAPAGTAAATARELAAGRLPRDVVTALGVPRRQAREAVEQALDLAHDAADLLLDRPAAVLLTFQPSRVRRLADICERIPGELFAQIASSSRASDGHVYAYRPGTIPDTPVRRAAEPSGATRLVEWGCRFFGLRSTST